jgi:hypothetical protein
MRCVCVLGLRKRHILIRISPARSEGAPNKERIDLIKKTAAEEENNLRQLPVNRTFNRYESKADLTPFL